VIPISHAGSFELIAPYIAPASQSEQTGPKGLKETGANAASQTDGERRSIQTV